MTLFDGLYLYEIVLLVCGVMLFLVLLAAFLRKVFTNQDYKGLLAFFVLPIAMIGYPSISSFEVKSGAADSEIQTTALQNKPQDQQAGQTLQSQVLRCESARLKCPTLRVTLARRPCALGA